MTLHGIVASFARYCACCLTGTWWAWSHNWLAIAASTLSSSTTNGI